MATFPRRASAALRAVVALTFAGFAATAIAPVSAAVGPEKATAAATSATKAPKSVHVRGQFIPIDDVGTYRVTGDLMGTWYTRTTDTYYQWDAMFIQKGVERFEGCLDLNRNRRCDGDQKGQFGANYVYILLAPINPQPGRPVKGECMHPVTGGSGAFAGLRGLITVHEKPVGKSGVVSTYQGDLVLNAVPEDRAEVSDAPAARSSQASVVTC